MNADRVMDNIRNAFERSGMTLNELGEGLGQLQEQPQVQPRAVGERVLRVVHDVRVVAPTVLPRVGAFAEEGKASAVVGDLQVAQPTVA